MSSDTFPSPNPAHRRADLIVHVIGLCLILIGAAFLITSAARSLETNMIVAVTVYIASVLGSNLASCAYHFAPFHEHRQLLRRIDHAAIYPCISGTFTPFFVQANTTWTGILLWVCWGLTGIAMLHKIFGAKVKTKWSTASYLGLGAIGLSALPDMTNVPLATLWCIIAGAAAYVIGTVFYTRKSMPYRYATWHMFGNFGGIFMFIGVWLALF